MQPQITAKNAIINVNKISVAVLELNIAEMKNFIDSNEDSMNTTLLEEVLSLMITIQNELLSSGRVKREDGKLKKMRLKINVQNKYA